MCVINYCPIGATISEETLKKMWDRNSDGAGFVGRLNVDSDWVFQKGLMTYDEAKTAILPFLTEEAEIVLHFRIKSKGDISAELTHPFEWSRNNKEMRLLFHNGTVRIFTGSDGCSDSSALSKLLTPISTKCAHKILEGFVTATYGRFVTFVQKHGEEAKITILEDKESEWKDGVWYSNLKHLEEPKVIIYGNNGNQHSRSGYNHVNLTPVVSLDTPEIKKIVDFYIARRKVQDTTTNRNNIIDHYSMGLYCKEFIDDICKKIDAEEEGDPIMKYFEA